MAFFVAYRFAEVDKISTDRACSRDPRVQIQTDDTTNFLPLRIFMSRIFSRSVSNRHPNINVDMSNFVLQIKDSVHYTHFVP